MSKNMLKSLPRGDIRIRIYQEGERGDLTPPSIALGFLRGNLLLPSLLVSIRHLISRLYIADEEKVAKTETVIFCL